MKSTAWAVLLVGSFIALLRVVGWLRKGTETIQRFLPNKPTRRLKLRCLGCVVEVLGLATKLFGRYSLQRPLRPGATEE